MGRLIEQQAVIDCLANTAKYYEREDADEWTKGIHYGLLHGVDNILDNVPTVEVIPKDQINKAIDKVEEYICDVETDTVRAQGMAQALDMIEQVLGEIEDGKID